MANGISAAICSRGGQPTWMVSEVGMPRVSGSARAAAAASSPAPPSGSQGTNCARTVTARMTAPGASTAPRFPPWAAPNLGGQDRLEQGMHAFATGPARGCSCMTCSASRQCPGMTKLACQSAEGINHAACIVTIMQDNDVGGWWTCQLQRADCLGQQVSMRKASAHSMQHQHQQLRCLQL